MYSFILFIHILVSVGLILIVLLQKGRGTDISSIFGGGGQNPFMGSRGTASFVSKLTVFLATVFMITSLYLSVRAGKQSGSSILEKAVVEESMKKPPVQPSGPLVEDTTMQTLPAMPTTITPLGQMKSGQ